MSEKHNLGLTPRENLRIIRSPVVESFDAGSEMPNLSEFGDRYTDTSLEFQREAGMLETQSITSHERVASCIGYFCMLWMTWLVVGLYDVRFITDSIFERLIRAIHLGAFVGFAVVAPKFDPSNQEITTMRAKSIVLMASRLGLTIEYGSILWHVRKSKIVHLAFYLQMSIHFIAAMIYHGITFRFTKSRESNVFITWYVVGALEALATFWLSTHFSVLSLAKTHLMDRLFLLSILGESIVVLSDKVVIIMKTAYLPPLRQMFWTMIHFPFHLALVVFMQGFTQFVQCNWIFYDPGKISHYQRTSAAKHDSRTSEIFHLISSKYSETHGLLNEALANITDIADSFWPKLARAFTMDDYELPDDKNLVIFANLLEGLYNAMDNSVFAVFDIDLRAESIKEDRVKGIINDQTATQSAASIDDATWDRDTLVFTYGYIAAGAWLGTGLVALLNLIDDKRTTYLVSPWLLPTICIVWTVVLVLTHIHEGPPLFKKRSLAPGHRGYNGYRPKNYSEHAQPMVSNMESSNSYTGSSGMPYGYQPAPQS
ncbi:hypothetical protein GGI35DRAFT_490891 [Trichoderma velutinum]